VSENLRPVRLAANQPRQFYRGGAAIADLRGLPATAEFGPEDWVGSITTQFGKDAGLSPLPDGTLLRDAVAADPTGWLGAAHAAKFGADTALLVKLLDAGQRLPVHYHPSDAFASDHLSCRHGKTEAWYVVAADEGAQVHLGFCQDVAATDLAARVERQDSAALLDVMHVRTVAPGDGILVPAGWPHAIGEGILLVEAQEPTDFSILLEWAGFDLDGWAEGHLGVGFPTALDAVDIRGHAPEEVDALVHRSADGRSDAPVAALPPAADEFFRVHVARPASTLTVPAGFAVVVALAGSGELGADKGTTPVSRGVVLAVPHGAGDWTLRGDVEAVVCRPALTAP
jgi:mannose-6-phosphate isomerase